LILGFLIISQTGLAQNHNGSGKDIEAPFNVTEVIERVSHHPIREGDKIVIQDRAYEAFFDEQGVILKPTKEKRKAEDLIIPIKERREIKDGKVIYHTEYGDILFYGTGHGLNFEERWKSSVYSGEHLITRYTGNVARLENAKTTEWSRTGEFLIDTNVVYVPAPGGQYSPSIAFDGTNYLVVWTDERSDIDIYGARVNPSGVVIDSFSVSTQQGGQISPALAHGIGNQFLITYSGWTDYINNHPANTMRIWGKFYPFVGIEEDLGISQNKSLILQIEPNPFSSKTRIKYGIAKSGGVLLKIYNVGGQCVKTLVNAKQNTGIYELNWDGRADNGLKLPQGIYILRLEHAGYTQTEKMMLLH
ncbi:MAG: FlgD immunoglobulin-like domain containing protein, partial [candidate division WOR-3 bacterium]